MNGVRLCVGVSPVRPVREIKVLTTIKVTKAPAEKGLAGMLALVCLYCTLKQRERPAVREHRDTWVGRQRTDGNGQWGSRQQPVTSGCALCVGVGRALDGVGWKQVLAFWVGKENPKAEGWLKIRRT